MNSRVFPSGTSPFEIDEHAFDVRLACRQMARDLSGWVCPRSSGATPLGIEAGQAGLLVACQLRRPPFACVR